MVGNLTTNDKYLAYCNFNEPQKICIYPIKSEVK